MEQTDVIELLDGLYSMIAEAWGVPLGNDKCIIEREKALDIINEIKAAMPSSLAEAKRLVAARDEFIGNAKKEAEALRKSSEEKAKAMVEEQEVIRVARRKSAEMISSAEAKSAELRRVAGDYVDDVMRRAEESLRSSLETIQTAHTAVQTANGVKKPAAAPAADSFEKFDREQRAVDENNFITLQCGPCGRQLRKVRPRTARRGREQLHHPAVSVQVSDRKGRPSGRPFRSSAIRFRSAFCGPKNIAFSVQMLYNMRACGHLLRENIKSGRRRKK